MTTYSIQITNLETNATWEKDVTGEEFAQVKDYCKQSRDAVALIRAACVPVRTDTLKNFAIDFFAPTLFNHAMKVQNTAGRIFASLAAIVFDIITFPIRIFTCIPRIIQNLSSEEHPLHKYLREQGVDTNILPADRVCVNLDQWIQDTHRVNYANHIWKSDYINFKEIPSHNGYVAFNSASGSSTNVLRKF